MSRNSSRRLGEFELIARLFAPLATDKGAFGLRDDVALLKLASHEELVLKSDAIVEGVHFFPNDPPDMIAKKALRVNLSDLAAKGAEPVGYMMTLALPSRISTRWLEKFCAGLRADQRRFSLSLLGGDTTSTPGPLAIAITAAGRVPSGRAVRRAGAKPGDLVFVSGTIGDAGLGLVLLRSGKRAPRQPIDRFLLPQPRLALGQSLRGLASASIDVSDGLLADLGHVAEVSRVRIAIDARRVPLSRDLKKLWGSDSRAVARAATSGDDYEVAFTCRPSNASKVMNVARKARTRVTRIGTVARGRGVVLEDAEGRAIRTGSKGYVHF